MSRRVVGIRGARRLGHGVGYVWASPATAVGLVLAALTWLTGGRVRWRGGIVEADRALARSLLESPRLHAGAITLGHVVLARDAASMDACRAHELGHVRQYELLGPLFLPAYLLAGLWARARGGHHYRDNWFERDADRRAGYWR